MSAPTVTSVAAASPAARAGLAVGDELLSLNGHEPRDVIDFQRLSDASDLSVMVRRAGSPLARLVRVDKAAGEPLGVEVSSAVFDRIRTCDNHCAFCFIYQLPKGMRRSLYLKDDDYRLSFLYGNFTTLTRFTELDAERILTERLGPLFVSIHTTDPELRARMLRNPKGATSLRWLSVLLEGGIEVHGQVVVCPGVNDGAALEDTMTGILDRYPALASVGVVPLGLSRYSNEPDMHPHTPVQAARVLDTVEEWQGVFRTALGHRTVFAADEYYLLTGRDLPPASRYEGYPQHENGIGMARAFTESFARRPPAPGASVTGSSPRSTPPLPRVTAPGASKPLRRGSTAVRSSCSPALMAPVCWSPCWPPTRVTTWSCARCRTTSSAATSGWPAS
jgi:putative radical SAM enzyme (TIGR03279 family)